MAKPNSPAPIATAAGERQVLFTPYEWPNAANGENPSGARAAEFTRRVRDVTSGVALLLSVLHQDAIDGEVEDGDGKPLPRLFSANDTSALQRMCISALKMAAHEASTFGDQLERSTQGHTATHGAAQ